MGNAPTVWDRALALDTSPFGVEWMRFDADCPIDKLIQTVPHIAFVVSNLDFELANRSLITITPPNLPSAGVRVAMVEHHGTPIELMEFDPSTQNAEPLWMVPTTTESFDQLDHPTTASASDPLHAVGPKEIHKALKLQDRPRSYLQLQRR